MIVVETVPIELSDYERHARLEEIAKMVFDLQDAGFNPCVAIETTSGGDSFVIEVDYDLGDG